MHEEKMICTQIYQHYEHTRTYPTVTYTRINIPGRLQQSKSIYKIDSYNKTCWKNCYLFPPETKMRPAPLQVNKWDYIELFRKQDFRFYLMYVVTEFLLHRNKKIELLLTDCAQIQYVHVHIYFVYMFVKSAVLFI